MTTDRPRVFLDVSIGQTPAGRLTIELFTDKTPKTCENFRQFCTAEHKGLSYAKVPFHRVIDEFMIQGGDIDKQDGSGTISIYGDGEFEDENLSWREMDAAGLVCSANRGRDTNGSQFFITLVPCEHLNSKHTIFGRLVAGEDVLSKIATVDVDKDDRPHEPVLIAHCGELEKRKKKQTTGVVTQAVPTLSGDRGRRRKSDDSDHEMDGTPEPEPDRRGRRQSDNIVDEGLRGRPRIRSTSRSVSRPLSTQQEKRSETPELSPTRLHKRKRSPPPSRHQTEADRLAHDEENEPRRRRSLPNQYDDSHRHRGVREDEARYRPSPKREDPRAAEGKYRVGNERRERSYKPYDRSGGGDSWRPSHKPARRDHGGRPERENTGRLGGGGGGGGGGGDSDNYDPPVKFKGRGVMKYREPGRL